MNASPQTKPTSTLADDELNAAIRGTQDQMKPMPGYDAAAVAASALDAYWQRAAAESGGLARGLEGETALSLRELAAGFSASEPATGFWRDLALATLPVIAALLTLALPGWFGLLPPWELPAIGVTVSAVVPFFLFVRSRQLDRGRADLHGSFWQRWRGSLGALAGGLIIAAVVGVSTYEATLRAAAMKLTLVERRMADFAVSSLAAVHQGGRFVEAPRKQAIGLAQWNWLLASSAPTLSFATEAASATEGIYRGMTAGLPGELVLRLTPSLGQLEWHQLGSTEVRDRFEIGRVVHKEKGKIELAADSGERLVLNLEDDRGLTLAEGQCLVACFNASTFVLKQVHTVAC